MITYIADLLKLNLKHLEVFFQFIGVELQRSASFMNLVVILH